MPNPSDQSVLALDVGERRIGVALANMAARLPSALETIDRHHTDPLHRLRELVVEHHAVMVVIGLPRGLDGQETRQTAAVQAYAKEVAKAVQIPTDFIDEAVTSLDAEAELNARRRGYTKADVDALAAVYILEDWLQNNPPQSAEAA